MSDAIPGASVFEQALYDRVVGHVSEEKDALDEYERLARSSESAAFSYLAGMILTDERRHHAMLADLASTIRASAEMRRGEGPIPVLDFDRAKDEVLDATERLLEVETQDNQELERLAKQLSGFKDTTLWNLMLDVMRADNAKHQMILKFVRRQARRGR